MKLYFMEIKMCAVDGRCKFNQIDYFKNYINRVRLDSQRFIFCWPSAGFDSDSSIKKFI